MPALHPDAELAPRDIVARGVFAEIAAGRGAFLDARAGGRRRFAEKFPTVYARLPVRPASTRRAQPIPVAPAEHYHMGGVATDARGRTSLPGLWAAGEVASTGVHGANRLASNSLLEAVVFGARAAADIDGTRARAARPLPAAKMPPRARAPPHDAAGLSELRRLMSTDVGVIRDAAGLAPRARRDPAHRARQPLPAPAQHGGGRAAWSPPRLAATRKPRRPLPHRFPAADPAGPPQLHDARRRPRHRPRRRRSRRGAGRDSLVTRNADQKPSRRARIDDFRMALRCRFTLCPNSVLARRRAVSARPRRGSRPRRRHHPSGDHPAGRARRAVIAARKPA